MEVCTYKYYNQAVIDANPETKKTDTFVRYLLCNQKAIQALTQAFLLAGTQQRQLGKSYCYVYFNIFKYLPDPCQNCTYCDGLPECRAYQSTTLYIFWITSQKMRNDAAFTADILANRKLTYYDNFTRQYKEMILDNLDVQVLLLYMMGEKIQNLYDASVRCFNYLTQGKDYCYIVNFPYDLAGCQLYPFQYSGRALRELTFTYSSAFANSTSPKGGACLLNRCDDPKGMEIK